MNPTSIGPNSLSAFDPNATDLGAPQTQASAAEFDKLITGMAAGLMSVVLEDMIRLAGSDNE